MVSEPQACFLLHVADSYFIGCPVNRPVHSAVLWFDLPVETCGNPGSILIEKVTKCHVM